MSRNGAWGWIWSWLSRGLSRYLFESSWQANMMMKGIWELGDSQMMAVSFDIRL